MEEFLKELQAGFAAFKAAQAKADESLRALIKEQIDGTKESIAAAVKTANEMAAKVQDVSKRLVEAEQKLVAGVYAGKAAPKSLGVLVAESDAFKAFAEGKTSKCRVVLNQEFDVFANTIIGQSGSPLTNSDTIVAPQRMPGIIPGAFRRLRARDLIPSGPTSSNMVEFTRELTFTDNAAETAEAAEKPESAITFELVQAPVKTIAHWIKVSRQVLDDAPALQAYIDVRMRYGVDLREDKQLIAGNGVGQNLTGMCIAPNMTAFTPTSGDKALDTINRIKYVIDNADYLATGIVLNPTDWGNIERTKVGSSDDRYVIGDPRSAMGPFLWGLPVVVTPSMTAGKLLIAAFDIAFMLWNRKETVVEMSASDDTNFQKNLITIRAEKRCALAGQRPASVRYGNLTL